MNVILRIQPQIKINIVFLFAIDTYSYSNIGACIFYKCGYVNTESSPIGIACHMYKLTTHSIVLFIFGVIIITQIKDHGRQQ